MPNKLEPGVIQQMLDILLRTGKKVVETDYLVALIKKPIGQVRTQESRATGNEHALTDMVGSGSN